ncbi:MAG: hypothetical protein WCI38_03485 [Chthoniobacterales bacterium]
MTFDDVGLKTIYYQQYACLPDFKIHEPLWSERRLKLFPPSLSARAKLHRRRLQQRPLDDARSSAASA